MALTTGLVAGITLSEPTRRLLDCSTCAYVPNIPHLPRGLFCLLCLYGEALLASRIFLAVCSSQGLDKGSSVGRLCADHSHGSLYRKLKRSEKNYKLS